MTGGTKHESLPRPSSLATSKYKYGHLMHVETYPNGGATVCHMYEDEIKHLSPEQREEIAREFLDVSTLKFDSNFFGKELSILGFFFKWKRILKFQ